MKIVSTTLVGAGRSGEAVRALQSAAGLVDEFVVVDTAPIDAPPIRLSVGVRVERLPWPGRFDVARNFCLDLARDAGADWSVMLDSDEALEYRDAAEVRAFLAGLDPLVKIVCADAWDGTYQRERFFRGGIPQRWRFRTHESIDPEPGEQTKIPRSIISWKESPKSGEMIRAKSLRDLEMIRADLIDYPAEPRLLFYLGNTLGHLGHEHYEEAIAAYRKVADVGVGEGCAWACFCAGRLYAELGRIASEAGDTAEAQRCAWKAIDCCSAGIHREPRIAELHWLAAVMHHGMGNHAVGQAYARQAKLHGYGTPSAEIRHGFMIPHALSDGPDIVEAMCIASMASDGVPVVPKFAPLRPAAPQREAASRIEYVRGPVHITVTSTALNAAQWAGRCIRSVRDQTWRDWGMHYVAVDGDTAQAADHASFGRVTVHEPHGRPPLLENLLPIWRVLPPEEVIVWLDGDDWLATDYALARVADAHSRGMWVTYGSFIYSDGRAGFAAPAPQDPRTGPWVTTHLKSFRAGLVQRVREADWRWPHKGDEREAGGYLDLAIDQAVMLPCLEMAGRERSEFVRETLCIYNEPHGFFANADDAERKREAEAVALVRSHRRYERVGAL